MKKIFIIANWKSNKTIKEADAWFLSIQDSGLRIENVNKEIIICPSFTLLSEGGLKVKSQELRFKIGAQNISQYEEGAYTGEVSGRQIKELAEFAVIGHSERRDNFAETDKIVGKKIDQAFKYELIPIICISNIEQVKNLKSKISNGKIIIAYEPLFAIGSGSPDTPENADRMCQEIKSILGEVPALYGGSVNKDNIKNFTKMLNIDGALVGKASLDPLEFLGIINNA